MDKSTLIYILTAGVMICIGALCVQYIVSSFMEECLEEEDEQVNRNSFVE